ncbi:TetR/AcrR family transcriptional regulator [Streptomyces griseomycini]|uniref:AcrR family transcriptional regulator n=1 Tax=Streptomyces griseomycini TaxID=66895 RepID=A0A7W7PR10_9ACTN|nr:TetR/AcrR family transcriptional regulator [Streptomyces griseomycini]MBB4898173.1 AcrR family transcriptional regulator [Streptomyces griseomycini]GGQ37949.1 TetR family transcriptional regulator [Streptomyces griseomycini]GGR53499.1 TetR family transcriptional regulator [Streptomyces griseomycini]
MDTSGEPRRIALTPAARRVLEAAGRLFYERGIHAVGVDLIAAEAGVTKKTLYDRFGSKEQIVVEYLAARDERWRAFLAPYLDAAGPEPAARVLAVFDASRAWAEEHGSKGCSMVNAHAEISDPAHPAHPVITGQKQWMLALFTGLAGEIAPDGAGRLGRALMLLHEGALVAHGLGVFADPVGRAREEARALLTAAEGAAARR